MDKLALRDTSFRCIDLDIYRFIEMDKLNVYMQISYVKT